MLVDSHCHLPLMEEKIEQIFATAGDLDVGYMLCVSVDLDTFPQIISIARSYPHVFASVGVHPNTETTHEPAVEEIARLADLPEVIAIGETGLDYYRSRGDLEWQRDRFRNHIRAAKQAMDLNFYISFSGIVTFRNAQQVQDVARRVPLERLLIETDAPYLAPVPYRGKPNQPGYVHYVARFLAELRGEDFEQLSRQTTDNFFNLFTESTRNN